MDRNNAVTGFLCIFSYHPCFSWPFPVEAFVLNAMQCNAKRREGKGGFKSDFFSSTSSEFFFFWAFGFLGCYFI